MNNKTYQKPTFSVVQATMSHMVCISGPGINGGEGGDMGYARIRNSSNDYLEDVNEVDAWEEYDEDDEE
jgi:hypothetical protein